MFIHSYPPCCLTNTQTDWAKLSDSLGYPLINILMLFSSCFRPFLSHPNPGRQWKLSRCTEATIGWMRVENPNNTTRLLLCMWDAVTFHLDDSGPRFLWLALGTSHCSLTLKFQHWPRVPFTSFI